MSAVKIPKWQDYLGQYCTKMQQMNVWYAVYLKKHETLNKTQHDWAMLETAKEIGVSIDDLKKELNTLKQKMEADCE